MSVSPDLIAAVPIAWPRRLSPASAVRAFVAAHPDFEGRVWVQTVSRARARYRDLANGLRWRTRTQRELWLVEDGRAIRMTRGERERRRELAYPVYGDVVIDLGHDSPRVGVWAPLACPVCNGTGESRSGRSLCLNCGGNGIVDGVRWLSVLA